MVETGPFRAQNLAEGVGFEPTNPFGSAVFKTAAFVRSATPPSTGNYEGLSRVVPEPEKDLARPLTRPALLCNVHGAVRPGDRLGQGLVLACRGGAHRHPERGSFPNRAGAANGAAHASQVTLRALLVCLGQQDEKLVVVDLKPKKKLPQPVTLSDIKADPAFAGWDLLRIGRLSVVPVPEAMWKRIEELSKQK